ncbi:MAG: response regulator [Pleomorphochaeta sp.]
MRNIKKYYIYIFIVILSILFSVVVKEFGESNIEHMKVQLLSENKERNAANIKFIISEIDELRKYNDEITVKKIIHDQIDNLPIDDNRDIWIYEIINYDGGDDFAKIIVPQNISESENDLISSDNENSIVLDAVKNNGKVFLSYHYPIYSDESLELKHSYFELYQDYNWIIGCGILESNLFSNVNNLSRIQSKIIIIFSTLLVMFSIIICKIIYDRKKKEKETNQLKYEKIIADKKNEAKTEFLSTISHELRTPLNAIIGLNDLLFQSIGSPSQIQEYSNKISESSQILLSLINDVLDMSAIEKSKIKIAEENFNLYLLIHSVSNIYSNLAIKKGLDYEVIMDDDTTEFLIGDSYRIRQIILNLLSNAIKFTDEGQIRLKVIEEKNESNNVILNIIVSDTGCGMKKDMINRLFNQFEQADASVVRKYGGSGLGLSITKNLVENMKGTIEVESKYGEGSTFIVKLPLKIGADDFKIVDKTKIKQKVLIIGNSDKNNKIFKVILEDWSVNFEELMISNDSLDNFEDNIINFETFIITVDFSFNIDSFDLATIIKRIKPESIVILLIGYNYLAIQNNNKNNINIDYFIHKPIIKKDLYFKLTRIYINQTDENIAKMENFIKGKNVLIVDDNKINLLVASTLLKNFGLQVTVSQSGQESINLVKSSKAFDIIFMDIRMPEMDGLTATRKIREINKDIPIVALSANAFEEDVRKSMEAGMNYHLSKPIDKKTLLFVLYKYLKDEID